MLVISRKTEEVICIGDEIRVKVLEVRGDKVRLGIFAPKNVRVDREEVWIARGGSKQTSAEGQATQRMQSSSHGPQGS